MTDIDLHTPTKALDLPSLSAQDFERQHIWHPYAKLPNPHTPILVQKAQGVHLYTTHGTLIDGISSWWAACLGYGVPSIDNAIKSQLDNMAHIMFGGLTHTPAINLGKKLLTLLNTHARFAHFDALFFADSGSVAVEVALKMALQFFDGARRQFATTRTGYHGDTWHAMSVSDPNQMHAKFAKSLPIQHFLPSPPIHFSKHDAQILDEFFAQHGNTLAGFIIEPILQGAGGMRVYDAAYLHHLRILCNQYGVLLIFDEIATGFGRLGAWFAFELAGVLPDIITLGKALTAGYMSMGAVATSKQVASVVGQNPLMHGPTFMANPLACSVACSAIDRLIQIDAPTQALRIGNILAHKLTIQRPWLQQVRHIGAVVALECVHGIEQGIFSQICARHSIWVRPFANVCYLMPAFIMDDKTVQMLCDNLIKALDEYFASTHASDNSGNCNDGNYRGGAV